METATDSKGAAAEQSLTNFVISPVSGTWGQENSSDRKPFKAIKSAYPKHNEPLKVCALEYLYAGSLARPELIIPIPSVSVGLISGAAFALESSSSRTTRQKDRPPLENRDPSRVRFELIRLISTRVFS